MEKVNAGYTDEQLDLIADYLVDLDPDGSAEGRRQPERVEDGRVQESGDR